MILAREKSIIKEQRMKYGRFICRFIRNIFDTEFKLEWFWEVEEYVENKLRVSEGYILKIVGRPWKNTVLLLKRCLLFSQWTMEQVFIKLKLDS